ncbi:hypothetical protein MHLP_02760 [Candidatus Mycoplasma haematolamae str. Purdue]|uniref:Ig-like domain-containing protein n=1 Tax=Mycoplasma haematolamae (strain Purdue) TaxID=1212765 RepID=I7C6I7_MYCHA|nr:hypothetical protein [Candidatus Mycoplasma haematolamae]AFO52132.1 hypothetical protein MHLP_02760 [Candidatus Mycoplasma haematolamae str. Purdue]
MGGLAKIAILLGAGGGVSAAVTPIVISSQNYNDQFRFTDLNGEKTTVILECVPQENKYSYPKVDKSTKTISCDYSADPNTLKNHWVSVYGNGVNTLHCSNKDGRDTDKLCYVKKFEKKSDGSISYIDN